MATFAFRRLPFYYTRRQQSALLVWKRCSWWFVMLGTIAAALAVFYEFDKCWHQTLNILRPATPVALWQTKNGKQMKIYCTNKVLKSKVSDQIQVALPLFFITLRRHSETLWLSLSNSFHVRSQSQLSVSVNWLLKISWRNLCGGSMSHWR